MNYKNRTSVSYYLKVKPVSQSTHADVKFNITWLVCNKRAHQFIGIGLYYDYNFVK